MTENPRHCRIVQIVEFNIAPNEACQPLAFEIAPNSPQIQCATDFERGEHWEVKRRKKKT